MCLAAVQRYSFAICYVLKTTPEICLAAVNRAGSALEAIPEESITNEVCLAAVQSYGPAFRHVPIKYATPEVCLAAVLNGAPLWMISKGRRTPEVCLAAISQDPNAIDHSPYSPLELMSF